MRLVLDEATEFHNASEVGQQRLRQKVKKSLATGR